MIDYEAIGRAIGNRVAKKQKAYGDSFGNAHRILKVLYPNGVKPEQYRDMLTVTRIIDKLFRIANEKEAFEEDPYSDIVGYGILGTSLKFKEKKREEENKIF